MPTTTKSPPDISSITDPPITSLLDVSNVAAELKGRLVCLAHFAAQMAGEAPNDEFWGGLSLLLRDCEAVADRLEHAYENEGAR